MPAGFDAELATLFRDLRGATNLSLGELAGRLGTQPNVIQALEEGAVYALPPWPETVRVVDGYGALLGLDVRPLLRRIHAQLTADITEPARRPQPAAPQTAPPPPANGGQPRPLAQPGSYQGQTPPPPQARPGGEAQGPDPMTAAPPPPPSWPPAGQQAGSPAQARRPAVPQQRPQQPQPMAEWSAEAEPAAAQRRRRADQAPAEPEPELATPRSKSRLVKWMVMALLVGGVLLGLWLMLPGQTGPALEEGAGADTEAQAPGPEETDGAVDPDDPKSRKSDRLPGPL